MQPLRGGGAISIPISGFHFRFFLPFYPNVCVILCFARPEKKKNILQGSRAPQEYVGFLTRSFLSDIFLDTQLKALWKRAEIIKIHTQTHIHADKARLV